MNRYQKKVNQNLRRFVREDVIATYIKPRKRSKLYKRTDERLISHRAVCKVVRKIMKDKTRNLDVLPLPSEHPVMPKEHKGFSFGKVVDFFKRGFRG